MARRDSDSFSVAFRIRVCVLITSEWVVCVTVMCSDKASEVWLQSILCPASLSAAVGHLSKFTHRQNVLGFTVSFFSLLSFVLYVHNNLLCASQIEIFCW